MKIRDLAFILVLCSLDSRGIGKPVKTDSVTFLITVNDSWKYDPPISNDTCMTTVKTFAMAPDTPKNKSKNIEVGDCDNGPLIYHVNEEEDTKSSIFLTFYSSVIEDASPPTCTIDWNYQYKAPSHFIGVVTDIEAEESLLPGCTTADSREGFHMTYYWFYIFDWSLSTDSSKFTAKFPGEPLAVASVTFLIAVNMTGNLCTATNKTLPMKPGVSADENAHVIVDGCDNATLNFSIITKKSSKMHTYVAVTFYSTAYPSGGPVGCTILWDYSYRIPTEKNPEQSLLPGCYTTYYLGGSPYTVYYWIYILDWEYDL